MNPRVLAPIAIAIIIMVVVGIQTSEALRQSGTWSTPLKPSVKPKTDPYASLDRALSSADSGAVIATAALRDPFSFGRVAAPPRVVVRTPVVPPPVARPVVTAILTDEETARAILRYEGLSYSVKAGDLFAQYRVVSIAADAVVVDDGKERLALRPPTKGE